MLPNSSHSWILHLPEDASPMIKGAVSLAPEQGALGVCTIQDSFGLGWEGVSDSCETETQITFTSWTSVETQPFLIF